MKTTHLTLKQRFAITLIIIALLFIVFLATAINQLKKVKEHHSLIEKTILLYDKVINLDSLQQILFITLPQDFNFYQTQKSNLVENIKKNIKETNHQIIDISKNFYLYNNKQVKTKCIEISNYINLYLQTLDNYLSIINQKGYENYGIVGQIQAISDILLKQAAQEKNQALIDKIIEIVDQKDIYLKNHDITTLNKLQIAIEELKTIAITSIKTDKINFINHTQKLHELILSLYDFDRHIGITPKDGLRGKINNQLSQITLQIIDLRNIITTQAKSSIYWGYFWLILLAVLILADLALLYYRINKFIHKPLEKLSEYLLQMVKGKLPDKILFKKHDEIAQMGYYLNSLVDGLKEKARFASEIGQNKLSSPYQPLSDEDILGNALIEMQKSLQKAEMEDQKYKSDEQKRIWTNEGLAIFGEILRLHNNDINILSDQIIQNLVKYLNAIQGALYFINDEDKNNPFIELYSAYAYDRKKHIKHQIAIGEGLIGTVVLEKEKIFITDIPENFLTIKSGLGESEPQCILIVPLKIEETVLGVVELAAFRVLEPHEIEFVEKIGQTIASTITNVKINLQTAKLLEKSQRQAEEMAEQEEEMRQNMEELRTTQEDFARRETELQGYLNAIHHATMLVTLDNKGKIIEANPKLLNFLQIKPDSIMGRNILEIINMPRDNFELIWDQLTLGKVKNIETTIRIGSGTELKLKVVFAPIFDKAANMNKVLLEFIDQTELFETTKLLDIRTKENENILNQYQLLLFTIDNALIRCSLSADCKFIEVNQNYCDTLGYLENELINQNYQDFLKDDEQEQFNTIWNELLKGKNYQGVTKRTKPTGDAVWLMSSFIPILNKKSKIERVIIYAQDITERKLKYQLLEEANKEIERLKKERKTEK